MTERTNHDLVANGDRLYRETDVPEDDGQFPSWAYKNWRAIAASLRERDEVREARDLLRRNLKDADDLLAAAYEENRALRVRAETAEADLIAARHSRDEFHRLWERERARADTAEQDAALAWYWVDTLKDNTTCSEQRDHLEVDQAAHRARIAGAGAE